MVIGNSAGLPIRTDLSQYTSYIIIIIIIIIVIVIDILIFVIIVLILLHIYGTYILYIYNICIQHPEVNYLRKDMGLPDDSQMAELDASGIKKLFSHGVRRMRTRSNTSAARWQ